MQELTSLPTSKEVTDGISASSRKRVALYSRVSTKEQTENYSLGVQKNGLKKYSHNNNYLWRIYEDAGFSATNMERPAFQRMINDVRLKKFEIIIVYRLDRLSRSVADSANIYEYLKSLGIKLISIEENIDTTTEIGEMLFYFLILGAQMERNRFLKRSKEGRDARIKSGKWKGGTTPFGYTYKKNQSGFLEIDNTEAKLVNIIFEKYLELGSLRLVCNYLNENEIPTRHGNYWQDNTIRAILRRKTYIGILDQAGFKFESEELRIVSDELFDKVQKLRGERRKYAPKTRKKEEIIGNKCINCGEVIFPEYNLCPYCGNVLWAEDVIKAY